MSRILWRFPGRRRSGHMVALPMLLSVVFIGGLALQAGPQMLHPLSSIGGCPLFPSNNIWNTDISRLPVDARSEQYIASIGLTGHVHPDFGAGLYDGEPIGIPYAVVPANQPLVPVHFDYADESDAGPYPVPANAPIEGGSQSDGDRHVLLVQQGSCKLYEMYASYPQADGSWQAGSGAVWNLNSNALRPAGWTSADAAGLPILPGLVRYDEVASGVIDHALRFTVQRTQKAYIWPARHQASSATDPALPPMGLRVRLKASVDISSFSPANQVILTALKRYGMIVGDNGSNWYLSGAPDDHWNNDDLAQLSHILGSDFEVVDTASLQVSANSGEARQNGTGSTATPSTGSSPSPTPAPSNSIAGLAPIAPTEGSQEQHQVQSAGASALVAMFFLVVGLGAILVFTLAVRRRIRRGRQGP
ncbi:MAG TPA: hypothetical protein VFU32_11365 [Ktedonobacterales bacterium]|nr:hypothetical protein [Ktedonobacterales bacterium]